MITAHGAARLRVAVPLSEVDEPDLFAIQRLALNQSEL